MNLRKGHSGMSLAAWGGRLAGTVLLACFITVTLGAGAAPASAANANLHLGKTVTTATDSPVLGLTLAVDRTSAIPRDTLTYTAVVTNTGSVLQVAGDLTAQNTEATTAVVASYFDAISTASNSHCGAGGDNDGQNTTPQWSPFVGTGASLSGYTPVQASPVSSGLRLTVTPVPAAGVVYPASGDPISLPGPRPPGTTRRRFRSLPPRRFFCSVRRR